MTGLHCLLQIDLTKEESLARLIFIYSEWPFSFAKEAKGHRKFLSQLQGVLFTPYSSAMNCHVGIKKSLGDSFF